MARSLQQLQDSCSTIHYSMLLCCHSIMLQNDSAAQLSVCTTKCVEALLLSLWSGLHRLLLYRLCCMDAVLRDMSYSLAQGIWPLWLYRW